MEIKLKGGRKLKVKNISVDDRDNLLDTVSYEYNEDGSFKGVKMMHSTMTKWIRTCLDGDSSDDFLKTLSMQDRVDIFMAMQDYIVLGEQKASK